MKYTKIYNEIISDYFNANQLIVVDLGDEVFISSRKEKSYFISKNQFLLDINKFKLSCENSIEASEFVRKRLDDKDYTYAIKGREIKEGNETFVCLYSIDDDGGYAWINKSFINIFHDPVFKVRTPIDLIMVYENRKDRLVKVACLEPYYFKNNEWENDDEIC